MSEIYLREMQVEFAVFIFSEVKYLIYKATKDFYIFVGNLRDCLNFID